MSRVLSGFKDSISLLAAAFMAGFPVIVLVGREIVSPSEIALIGVFVLALRLLTMPKGANQLRWVWLAFSAAFLTIAGVSGNQSLTLMYPAIINAALMLVFGATLLKPPSLAERMARWRGQDVSPQGVIYTKWVTLVWTVFFFCNGLVCAYLAFRSDLIAWGIYTGVVSYVLAGLIMVIELTFRHFYKARVRRNEEQARLQSR